jgi:phenylpropionate dioxygenase-like ring-hydroxylating dioxygenase large terminal subunit
MFLSHVSSVPFNAFQVLEQCDNQKIIANDGTDYKIISNVCPHQKSLISKTHGIGNRVCPYHNWSFELGGAPLTSGRTAYYCKNENHLESLPAFVWNGLLFNQPVSFDCSIDFNNMSLVESRVDIVNTDYRNIMDLFLDVDHIQSIHAGVYDLIGITNTQVTWDYYTNGSVQRVDQGALWISVYPYTMIEWQRGSLFITVATPKGNISKVSVFKYIDKDYNTQWKLNEQVWETAWAQDKAQAEIITRFADENLEPQKQHFREFLKINGTY